MRYITHLRRSRKHDLLGIQYMSAGVIVAVTIYLTVVVTNYY